MLDNNYKLIIYGKRIYREIELSDTSSDVIRIGTSKDCQVRFNGELFFDNFSLQLIRRDSTWQISCLDSLYFTKDGIMKEYSQILKHGDELSVQYEEYHSELFRMSFLINFDINPQNYERRISIADRNQISIGGVSSCDVYIKDSLVGKDQLLLIREEDRYTIRPILTTYGIYKNGYRLEDHIEIEDYDFFMLDGYHFYIKDNQLYTSKSKELIINGLEYTDISEQDSAYVYPHFNRSTRINYKIPDEGIEVYPPEIKPKKPKKNILLTLVPSFAMLALVVLVRGRMGSGGSFVIYSACSMGIGIIMSIVTYINDGREYRKEIALREKNYLEYAKETEEEIALLREKEKEILEKIYTSMEDNIEKVEKFDRKLFEKDTQDEDYLRIRLGAGKITSHCETAFTKQKFKNTEDDLVNIPERLEEKFRYIEDSPIVVNLKEANGVGCVGSRDNLYEMLKNITLDITIRHYYKTVKLYYMFSEEDKDRFEWIHWLQHVDNDNVDIKNLMYDEESCNFNLELLYSELTKREALSNNKEMEFDENYIIFIFHSKNIARHPITKYIVEGSELGFTFIFFEEHMEYLPIGCKYIIELDDIEKKGVLISSENGEESHDFIYPHVMDNTARKIAIKLSSIYVDEVNLESELTKNITLFELLDIISVTDLDLAQRWKESKVYKSMAAALGVRKKGEIVYLDISDKSSAHGPHGLVAGTTGSGKSEILQSYVLSMASEFHPYDVGFVIIDFKGGGMANQFANLPHLMGAITNIDGREINRSLLSIKSELVRRQEIFAQYKVNHINDYIKLFKENKADQPLPHLIMIVDEFAELKSEYPDFMKEIISAARIGRTLGVHLILATQKPAGVVDSQVWSNSKFKLCLKVQTKEDSMEVIKTALASEIVEPGRAYFQVGNNEIFELFQSAYSGAKVLDLDGENKETIEIYEKNLWGKKELIYTSQKAQEEKDAKNQLEVMVEHIQEFCEKNGIGKLPGICLPSLNDIIYMADLKEGVDTNLGITIPIGIFDDPELQLQEEVYLNISDDNTYIIGSAQTGKTTLLQTIIYSIMQYYTPEQIHMYIIDCGSMSLKMFEESHFVGGVALSTEEEKVANLFKLIKQIMTQRKEILAEKGLGTYKSYLEAGFTDMPQILLVIDNIAEFKEYYGDLNDTLQNISRDCLGAGISLILTSTLTNTIGFKMLPNFGRKIALNCNDKGEYSNLFSRCRMEPKEAPGRGLCAIDKRVVEFQVALCVPGTKEYMRVAQMKEYIKDKNLIYSHVKAIPIPVVPEIVTRSELVTDRPDLYEIPYQIPIGIEYDSVSYHRLDLLKTYMFAVIGRDKSGKTNFVKQILTVIEQNVFRNYTEVYIFDSMERQFYDVKEYNIVKEYTMDSSKAETIFENIQAELLRRKELVLNRDPEQSEEDILGSLPLIMLVIEDRDLFKNITADKKLQDYILSFVKELKNMKVCVFFSNMENMQVPFNAGELLKVIKDNKKAIIFEEASNFKFYELSMKQQKEYVKPITPGDGYLCIAGDIKKMKTIYDD